MQIISVRMGVTYYNCVVCGEISSTCDEHGHCKGCWANWCQDCLDSNTTFRYGDKIKCEECIIRKGEEITDTLLLDFVLEQFSTTRDEMIAKLKRQRPELEQERTYECQSKRKKHKCAPDCIHLSEDNKDERGEKPHIRRGLCCPIAFPKAKKKWCEECSSKV